MVLPLPRSDFFTNRLVLLRLQKFNFKPRWIEHSCAVFSLPAELFCSIAPGRRAAGGQLRRQVLVLRMLQMLVEVHHENVP